MEYSVRITGEFQPFVSGKDLILNYLVAYKTLCRAAKAKAGEKLLIVGASGGIGTALLQLGKLADLKMYGIASSLFSCYSNNNVS